MHWPGWRRTAKEFTRGESPLEQESRADDILKSTEAAVAPAEAAPSPAPAEPTLQLRRSRPRSRPKSRQSIWRAKPQADPLRSRNPRKTGSRMPCSNSLCRPPSWTGSSSRHAERGATARLRGPPLGTQPHRPRGAADALLADGPDIAELQLPPEEPPLEPPRPEAPPAGNPSLWKQRLAQRPLGTGWGPSRAPSGARPIGAFRGPAIGLQPARRRTVFGMPSGALHNAGDRQLRRRFPIRRGYPPPRVWVLGAHVYADFGAPLLAPANLARLSTAPVGRDRRSGRQRRAARAREHHEHDRQLQPFPLLRVTLADRFGTRIGPRDFEPAEYLGKPTTRTAGAGRTRRCDYRHPGSRARTPKASKSTSACAAPTAPACAAPTTAAGAAPQAKDAVKIGPYALPSNVLLAPMAGVTDRPFRMLCRRLGAGLAASEMLDRRRAPVGARDKSRRRMDHERRTEAAGSADRRLRSRR